MIAAEPAPAGRRAAPAVPLVLVTSGFPRRSETFLLNELAELDRRGALAAVFATKPGDDAPLQPGARRLARRVQLLAPGTADEQAADLVRRLDGAPVAGVHGYFAHRPAAVAAAAARRLGVPYGFSTHARDARKVPPAELGALARGAACVIACNDDVAEEIRRAGGSPRLVPHGVDVERFRPPRARVRGVLEVLAVGRLVEKKGFDVLLRAAAAVRAPMRVRIVGDGPLAAPLDALRRELGVEARVALAGARTHDDLPALYAASHVVCVPSVRDRSGDRDGLPNVVLEAMASGCALVATDAGAITSAVRHGRTGLVVPPGDAGALAAALECLATRPALRERLGRTARDTAAERFGLAGCTDRLARTLEAAYG